MWTTLHVNTEKGWRGGEQQMAYLLEGLRSRGHRVVADVPRGRILRSVLMKPESEPALDGVRDEEGGHEPADGEEHGGRDGDETEAAQRHEDGEGRDPGENRQGKDAPAGGRLPVSPILLVHHATARILKRTASRVNQMYVALYAMKARRISRTDVGGSF
jgi:hypothetical protein